MADKRVWLWWCGWCCGVPWWSLVDVFVGENGSNAREYSEREREEKLLAFSGVEKVDERGHARAGGWGKVQFFVYRGRAARLGTKLHPCCWTWDWQLLTLVALHWVRILVLHLNRLISWWWEWLFREHLGTCLGWVRRAGMALAKHNETKCIFVCGHEITAFGNLT